jgi:hypothetical protein
MLCHRFGILQKAIPTKISIAKTTAMVYCLCRLHNFCIDNDDANVPKARDNDLLTFTVESGIQGGGGEDPLNYDNNYRPVELLDAGHHQNDFDRHSVRSKTYNGVVLPRKRMLEVVIEKDLKRPTPIRWKKRIQNKKDIKCKKI